MFEINNPYGINYNQGNNALQSNAFSGQISGGTAAEQAQAAKLSKRNKSLNSGATAGAIASVGGAALNALDKNPDYDNMDVLKSGAKYASAGAALGPVGAAVGLVAGVGIGMFEKKKFEEEKKEAEAEEIKQKSIADSLRVNAESADRFYRNQDTATAHAYGVKDIDNFLNKYNG